MTVTKRDGSKFWYIQFQFNGKTFIKSSKTTDKQLAHDLESQWRMQLIKQHQLGTKAPIDIPKAFQIFTNSKKDIETHPRLVSYCSYAIVYWSHLEYLHQISTEKIEQYRNHLHSIGLSNATIKHKLHPVGATIKYAKKLGYQTSEVEMPKVKVTKGNHWKLRKQFAMFNRLIDNNKIAEYQYKAKFLPIDRLRKHLSVLSDDQSAPFLLRGILSQTPIFLKNEFISDVEFTSSDLKKFIQVCIKLKSIIERQLDINIRKDIKSKPASQLGVFLNLIGIKTVKSRTEKTKNGGKTYFYKIDDKSLRQMNNLIALEEQRKTPWEAINTRYGFKTA